MSTETPSLNESQAPHESFVAPNFNLQETLDHLEGPFIEVGGPSAQPFTLMAGIELSQPVFATNIHDTVAPVPADKINAWADTRRWPFADESLGAIFSSALSRQDDSPAVQHGMDYMRKQMKSWGELRDLLYRTRGFEAAMRNNRGDLAFSLRPYSRDNPEHHELIKEMEDYYDARMPKEEEFVIDPAKYTFNPMVSLMLEAQRTLQPGGLLVVRGILNGEVEVLQNLGFVIKAAKSWEDYITETQGDSGAQEESSETYEDDEEEFDFEDESEDDNEINSRLPDKDYWAYEVIFQKQ